MKELTVNSTVAAFTREALRHPLLSGEEEFALAVRHRETGDLEAAHKLVTSNLRFVVKIARRYEGYGTPLADLIQEGCIGLMTAVKRFDPYRGYRLLSYAVWWIRAKIHEHIMRFRNTVAIGGGRAERKLFQNMTGAKRALAARGGKNGTDEIAEMLGVSAGEITAAEMKMSARDFSLDSTVAEDNPRSGTYISALADASPSQETVIAEAEAGEVRKNTLARAMENLGGREKEIVRARFLSDEIATLEDLGTRFGVSAERIRQIEKGAVAKLKKSPEVALAKKIT